MKKVLVFAAVLLAAVCSAKAEVKFGYDAGAEIVSAYIWRGQYNGGLSFQPDLEIGFDSEHMSLRVGAWASVGASDWKFQKGLLSSDDFNPNTYFVPEVDIIGHFSFFGATVGFNHYFYFDGHSFLNWKSVADIDAEGGKSTTEVYVGYNFSQMFGDKAGAYISYLEVGYDYTWEDVGVTLGAQVGMSPWRSDEMYSNEKFAVTNISLKINKEWEVGPCTIALFAQGSLNPDGMVTDRKDPDYNIYINKAGDEKRYLQKLNGVIGIGFWF